MATRQEAYALIDHLDGEDLQRAVDYLSRLRPAPEDAEKRRMEKRRAFEELEKMRKELSKRIPSDYDFDAAREEAMREKYGKYL